VAGQDTLAAWQMLKPYVAHFHIKDATTDPRRIVPAGEGEGHIPEILADAHAGGIDCALSLEPHLRPEGPYEGMDGPARFKVAADALKRVCADAGIPLT
jgi:sugar phosphate isomerase/epimerase